MKKVISAIMVLVMSLALLTGCGGEQTTAKGTSTTSSEESQSTNNGSKEGEVVITFATSVYVEEPHQKAIDALIEAYNAKNNGVKIEVYGAGYADFWDNVTVEIMGGNEADILQVYPENVVSYNSLRAEGVFENLSQYMGDSDYESTLAGQDMCTFDGGTLALSNYAWGTTGFFYRKSILEEAGVDPDAINTWEDFYSASQKIADAGKIPMGIVDSSHAFVVSEWSRIMARSISGGLYFPDGESGPYVSDRLQVNAPANVWAAQEWQRYFLTDGLGKSSPDKKDVREYFWNGLAAFNHDGPWFIGMTAEHDPVLMDDIGLIPIFDIEYEGKTYKPAPTMYPLVTCLSQKAEHKQEAWDFMAWMTSEEAQKIIATCGMIPASVEYANSSEYNEEYELASVFVSFLESYAPQIADPFIPQQGELNQVLIDATQRIFAGGEDPKSVLDEANEQCKMVMER